MAFIQLKRRSREKALNLNVANEEAGVRIYLKNQPSYLTKLD